MDMKLFTTWTSPVGQTLTGFTMSFSGGDNSSTMKVNL